MLEAIANKLKNKSPNTNQQSPSTINFAICPVCTSVTSYMYFMKRGDTEEKSQWYRCNCGVVWQDRAPRAFDTKKGTKPVYNEEYINGYLANGEKHIASAKYGCRVYAPIIEDLMYGRKMLDIGFNTRFNMQAFQERGWVAFGTEVNDSIKEDSRTFVGSFEEIKFPESLDFNLIWMSHVFEHFKDPIDVLRKCYSMLKEDGCLFIATPDTDFIFTRSSSGFNHFSRDEHYIMWNMTSLVKELERIGFNVIVKRRNYEQRYVSWDDIHILAQKKFF